MYMDTNPITLPCSLARVGNKVSYKPGFVIVYSLCWSNHFLASTIVLARAEICETKKYKFIGHIVGILFYLHSIGITRTNQTCCTCINELILKLRSIND